MSIYDPPTAEEQYEAATRRRDVLRRGRALRRHRHLARAGGAAAVVAAVAVPSALVGFGGGREAAQRVTTVPPAVKATPSPAPTAPTASTTPSTVPPAPPRTAIAPAPPAASPRSTTTTSAPPRPAAATGCGSSALAVSIDGGPSGSAGGFYYELAFTNRSSSTCTIYGYPGVSFLDPQGQQIGAPMDRDANRQPALVTVAAGQTAYAVFRITDPSAENCPAAAASEVRVYPPGQTLAVVVPLRGGSQAVCSQGRSPGFVDPVSATSTAF